MILQVNKTFWIFKINQILFDGRFYNQIDDVAMGSTFAPIFSKPFYGIPPDRMTLNFNREEVILHWPNGYDSIYLFNSKSHTPKL